MRYVQNNIRIFAYLLTFALPFVTSCGDYLDQVPQDILTLEKTFESRESSLRYLASVYTYMPDEFDQRSPGGGRGQGTAGAWVAGSDEAEYVWESHGSNIVTNGSLNPSSGLVGTYWNKYYKGIRSATILIDNLHLCKLLYPGDYEQWTAEARAVRAIYYYYLMRLYGPVPVLETALSEQASNEALQIPRNSVEEVGNYILSELQLAMESGLIENIKLSGNHTSSDKGLGHIDQAIAKAFKVQTRMLMASDLFNGSNPYFANLANPDGKRLFPNYDDAKKRQLWADAAREAKEFIDHFIGRGYDLTRIYTNGKLDPYLSYREAIRGYRSEMTNFSTTSTSAIEMIHFRIDTPTDILQYDRTPKHFGAGRAAYEASSALGASQEIVDSYFMANGMKPITGYESDNKTPIINGQSGYKEDGFSDSDYLDPVTGRLFAPAGVLNAWVGREPRFYADITFDGQRWLNTSEGIVYTSTQYSGNSGKGVGSSNDYTKTGYVVRKSAPLGNWRDGNRINILLRVSQIYLDYAEALQESDPGNPDILTYINIIRERAGIPLYGAELPVPSDMRQAIRDERRVELAFETNRYFDVRRWCIAEQTENKPIHGMNIEKNGLDFFKRTVVENRIFEKKNYFFPIPERDININRALVQNTGW